MAMLPWENVARARAPDGTELVLARRGEEWVVRAGGRVLMPSRTHGSEEALATLALGRVPRARTVLIGGLGLGYTLHCWRTAARLEVDFVLYGQRGLRAFEVKRTPRVRDEDLRGLRAFVTDYPMATAWLVYGGSRRYREGPIEVIPIEACLRELPHLLGA